MSQYNGMTLDDFRKMQAAKKDSDMKIGIVKLLQDKIVEATTLMNEGSKVLEATQHRVEIRDAEIKDLKAKLKSRDERIEHLEEKNLRLEKNKGIWTRFVEQHKIRKIR